MADAGHKETDRELRKLEKKLNRVYADATRAAEDKFQQFMSDFARKEKQHLADVKSGKWTQEEFDKWRKAQLMSSRQLKEMQKTLATDLNNVDRIAQKMMREHQKDVYAINHNYATYQVEHDANVDTSYTLYDHDTVERLMREDPDLLPPPSKKRQREIDALDMRWNRQKLSSAFMTSILAGDSIPEMAKRISSVAAMDYRAAVRNARTMTTGAESAGRVDGYKRAQAMGINLEQEWVSTLDNRTRASHVSLDGERAKVGKKFSNGLRFPGDPSGKPAEVYNCRCTLVAVVEGIDPMTSINKSETLMRTTGMTYEQWKREKGKHVNKSISLEDFEKVKKDKTGIPDEIIDSVYDILKRHDALDCFDDVCAKSLGEKIVFNTNTIQKGSWCSSELQINSDKLSGKSKSSVDKMFRDAINTVCNSLEDGVTHEEYHARMSQKVNYAVYERLSQTKGPQGISKTADQDVLELISEIGVLREHGKYNTISEEAKRIFEEYFEVNE